MKSLSTLQRRLIFSTDELLGLKNPKSDTKKTSLKLQRRINKIEALPLSEQKVLLRTIDTFLKGAAR